MQIDESVSFRASAVMKEGKEEGASFGVMKLQAKGSLMSWSELSLGALWSYGSDMEDFVLELVEKREPHITICSCMRALSREEHTCVLVHGFLFRVLSNGVRTKGYTCSYNLFEEEKEDRY
jgi:hypothetical protein